jgi:hypothetical protein
MIKRSYLLKNSIVIYDDKNNNNSERIVKQS